MFLAGNLLQCEDLTTTDYYAAVLAVYQDTDHVLGSDESVMSVDQCIGKTDQVRNEGQPRIQEDASNELT